jgi:glutamate 5-kinase
MAPLISNQRDTSAIAPSLGGFRRIVVKIGSALLVDPQTGKLRTAWLASLADDVAALVGDGTSVLIVSSGAIALGRSLVGLPLGPLRLEESQAAAAAGQIALAHAYQEALGKRGITAAQVLLTLGDTEQRRRYLNARTTIETLLRLNSVPVINENDTVATSEIRYGDNDRLAARVASMVSADCLVLLSDVDGLFTAPPGSAGGATLIPEVRSITPQIEAMAGDAGTGLSRGGMITKIEAGKIALAAGAHMAITKGAVAHPLRRLAEGCQATWFIPSASPVAARKKWISGTLEPRGTVNVDAGAAKALARGKSLLPAGVTGVEGSFSRGDAVIIRDHTGHELGRGLSAYDILDARKIVGRRSGEIEPILGFAGRSELIHRDDLVLRKGFDPTDGDRHGGAGNGDGDGDGDGDEVE